MQVDRLKSIPYFSALATADLESISSKVFETKMERGEIISLEGEPATVLYFVVSGAVKLVKTSAEGREQIITIVRPGESFNDVAVFDGAPNPVTAQAMTSVALQGISKENVDMLFAQYPLLARSAITVLASRIRELMALVEDLSFRTVMSRLARILLEQVSQPVLSQPHLTQQEMAALVGTAREVIGRSLKALEESNAIRMDRHRIVVTDRATLSQIARR